MQGVNGARNSTAVEPAVSLTLNMHTSSRIIAFFERFFSPDSSWIHSLVIKQSSPQSFLSRWHQRLMLPTGIVPEDPGSPYLEY